ncbi:MAG: DUF928 domain-containing protein [Spirulinaceae cyanobacterium]
MKLLNSVPFASKFALLLACTVFGFVNILPLILVVNSSARTNNLIKENETEASSKIVFIPRTRREEEGEPYNQSSDGTYGEDRCPQSVPSLTALVPGKGLEESETEPAATEKTYWSITAQEFPTLWFYVPYPTSGELEAKLKVMTNETREVVYNNIYQLNGTPGIIGLTIKDEALVVGKDYHWSFTIICDPENRDSDVYVQGKIARVAATPKFTPLPTAKPEEKVDLYARDGLWNETLTTIFTELYPSNPKQAKEYLRGLLGSEYVNLESLAEQPVVPCCDSSY